MVTRATCEFASHLLHQLSHLIVKMHQMLALNEIACLFIHLSLFSYILFLQTMSGGFYAIFICSLGAATLSCSVSSQDPRMGLAESLSFGRAGVGALTHIF